MVTIIIWKSVGSYNNNLCYNDNLEICWWLQWKSENLLVVRMIIWKSVSGYIEILD